MKRRGIGGAPSRQRSGGDAHIGNEVEHFLCDVGLASSRLASDHDGLALRGCMQRGA